VRKCNNEENDVHNTLTLSCEDDYGTCNMKKILTLIIRF